MGGLKVKNVCLSECKKKKKKGSKLWGLVSIYRGQKTLKNRYGWLGFESDASFCKKIENGMHNCHSKAVGSMPTLGKFSPFRYSKVLNWPYGSEFTFVFGCRLDFSSRVFCQSLYLDAFHPLPMIFHLFFG